MVTPSPHVSPPLHCLPSALPLLLYRLHKRGKETLGNTNERQLLLITTIAASDAPALVSPMRFTTDLFTVCRIHGNVQKHVSSSLGRKASTRQFVCQYMAAGEPFLTAVTMNSTTTKPSYIHADGGVCDPADVTAKKPLPCNACASVTRMKLDAVFSKTPLCESCILAKRMTVVRLAQAQLLDAPPRPEATCSISPASSGRRACITRLMGLN